MQHCLLALCLLLTSCAGAVSENGGRHSSRMKKRGNNQYILDFLVYGPSNQKRDLRSALALAKELGTGIVLTGIFKHYTDRQAKEALLKKLHARGKKPADKQTCFVHDKQDFMDFTEVFDREPIDEWVPTITLDELREQGWDEKIDVLVHPKDVSLKHLETQRDIQRYASGDFLNWYIWDQLQSLNMTLPKRLPLIPTDPWLTCGSTEMARLKKKIKPYKIIGVVSVALQHNQAPASTSLRRIFSKSPAKRCDHYTHQAAGLPQPAPWLQELASRYIKQQLVAGKKDKRFIAVHIRPYPDECLRLWKKGDLSDEDLISRQCHRRVRDLHTRVGRCTVKLMRDTGIKTVFVAIHPKAKKTATELLAKAGVTDPQFLDEEVVQELAGCSDNSATFMLTVEGAIAHRAAVFMGTQVSSITEDIVHMRWAAGRRDNHYFHSYEC